MSRFPQDTAGDRNRRLETRNRLRNSCDYQDHDVGKMYGMTRDSMPKINIDYWHRVPSGINPW